jgi:hypothetical protein
MAAFLEGAAAPAATAAEAGLGGGGAVAGDRGWDLVADLETAAAIAGGFAWESGNAGNVVASSDLNWRGAGFGLGLEAFGGESEEKLVGFGEILNRAMGFVDDLGTR